MPGSSKGVKQRGLGSLVQVLGIMGQWLLTVLGVFKKNFQYRCIAWRQVID